MKVNKKWVIGGIILLLSGLIYLRAKTPEDTWICQSGVWVKHGNPSFPQPTSKCTDGEQVISAEDAAKLPNPASQNCIDKGGKLEMVQETAGTLGICRFADGTACEEWQFFRNECSVGKTINADTSHPYTGKIVRKNSNYVFVTETGVEYELIVDNKNKSLTDRLQKEAGQNLSIIATETPVLSKKLTLVSFPSK
jgi:uncharacterized protein